MGKRGKSSRCKKVKQGKKKSPVRVKQKSRQDKECMKHATRNKMTNFLKIQMLCHKPLACIVFYLENDRKIAESDHLKEPFKCTIETPRLP